jgi:hypothetical protein
LTSIHEKDVKILEEIIEVNIKASIHLAHAAVPGMLSANEKGLNTGRYRTRAIINLSSVAAFTLYTPNIVYRSTKLFLKGFSESLSFELRDKGVRVQALCPGLTKTDMYRKLGYTDDHPIYTKYRFMSPEQVADSSVKCLMRNRVVCVPGLNNKFLVFAFSRLPRWAFYAFYPVFIKGKGSLVRWKNGKQA